MHRLAIAVCLAVAPLLASAAIYKVEMPDGTILFTDTPPAGAKILEERQTKSTPRPAPPKGGAGASAGTGSGSSAVPPPPVRVLPSPGADGIPPGSTVRRIPRNIEEAQAEIADAERELAVLRRKLEIGREPQPGERLGTAKGGSRLSPEYEARVSSLEREVSLAEDRVKRAYETRNSLK
jgi:hypothetical protein